MIDFQIDSCSEDVVSSQMVYHTVEKVYNENNLIYKELKLASRP